MSRLIIKYLDWDSKQFGVKCGLIDRSGLDDKVQDNAIAKMVKSLCSNKNNFDFVTIKLPSNNLTSVNSLIKSGAFLVNVEIIYSYQRRKIQEDCGLSDKKVRLMFCKKCNSNDFIPLAKDMAFSRFFVDPNISRHKAIQIWKESIKNHCEGLSDRLLIAYYNDKPAGIIAMKFKDRKRIFLHIVGVLKRFRGKNIGKLMLMEIIKHYAKNYCIFVETQSDNFSARSVYQKVGFKYYDLKYILHYWRIQKNNCGSERNGKN